MSRFGFSVQEKSATSDAGAGDIIRLIFRDWQRWLRFAEGSSRSDEYYYSELRRKSKYSKLTIFRAKNCENA